MLKGQRKALERDSRKKEAWRVRVEGHILQCVDKASQ